MKRLLVVLVIIGMIVNIGIRVLSEEIPEIKDEFSVIPELIKQLGGDDREKLKSAQKEIIRIGESLIGEYRKKSSDERRKMIAGIERFALILREADKLDNPEIKKWCDKLCQYFVRFCNQSQIVFISKKKEVYVMDADGKNQTKLSGDLEVAFPWAIWKPDGSQIAFIARTREGKRDIYIVDTDGKNQKKLTQSGEVDIPLDWSPDGNKIAFSVRPVTGSADVYIIDADGTNQKKLSKVKAFNIVLIKWNPEANDIAFCFNTSKGYDGKTYVIDIDGKNQHRYDNFPKWVLDSDSGITITKDGTKRLWTSSLSVFNPDAKNYKIYIVDVNFNDYKDKLPEKYITEGYSPVWSPDGAKITFCSDKEGQWEIYTVDIDGKNQKRLTEIGIEPSQPRWSPPLSPELVKLFIRDKDSK